MPKLILASTSKYRKALLERIGLSPECIAPGVDEVAFKQEFSDPIELAVKLAEAKARAVADRYPGEIVIGGDQLATIHGRVLGKPGTVEAAVDQLEVLSGKTHTLVTAMSVVGPDGEVHSHLDLSYLTMRPLDREALQRYVERDMPIDCAGSYKLEESGIALFERIQADDYNAITGLPLLGLVKILSQLSVVIPV